MVRMSKRVTLTKFVNKAASRLTGIEVKLNEIVTKENE
jgi:hypothetical protein